MAWLAQNESFYSQNLYRFYLDQLTSVNGVMALVALLLGASLMLGFDRLKWVALGLALYVSTFSYQRVLPGFELPQPFYFLSSVAQPLTLGILALVLVAVLKPVPWHRLKPIHPILVALLATQLVYALIQIAVGGFLFKGVVSLWTWIGLFILLGYGVSRWLNDSSHVRNLARTVCVAVLALLSSSMILLLFDYGKAFIGGRFAGTTDNPQRMGIMLALAMPFIGVALNDRGSRLWRGLAAFAGVLTLIALPLSGSRTAAVVACTGLFLFFRQRLARGLVFAICAALVLVIAWASLEADLRVAGDRVISTADTRTAVWARAWNIFVSKPIFGIPSEYVIVESSYLSVAAGAGIVGIIPLSVLVYLMCRTGLRLHRSARQLGDMRLAADFAVAFLGQQLILWVFEGFLLGLVTNFSLVFYYAATIVGFADERSSASMRDVADLADETTDLGLGQGAAPVHGPVY